MSADRQEPDAAVATTRAARRRAVVTTLVAVAVLALGFLDLARGGITYSAFLLLAGYVVCIPLAIVAWTAPELRGRARRASATRAAGTR